MNSGTRTVLLLLIIAGLASCQNETEPSSSTSTTKDSVQEEEAALSRPDTMTSSTTPSQRFIRLAHHLDTSGYRPDTNRLQKIEAYPALKQGERQFVKGYPFYRLKLQHHPILHFTHRKYDIDTSVFRQVQQIWGYFYRQQTEENWIPDGVIEEWQFSSDTFARSALHQLEKNHPMPYFNTNPHYGHHNNFLYLFHTRAMAFSSSQKRIYRQFKKWSAR